MNIAEAKKTDLVDYLQSLGHKPQKITGNDYWYCSPLREEKTASFKVNRAKNVWYDHGLGVGGNIIDFGKLYYRCTLKELLEKLRSENKGLLPFHQPKKEIISSPQKIIVLRESEITDPTLRNYLHSRHIPLPIANQYCHQVSFEIKGHKQLAIGFKNAGGGYELRNYNFKGSSTPKEPRLILEKNTNELVVFEGFFNFLSFKTMTHLPIKQANILVLNSIAFFEKKRQLMEQYENIHLFLDRDKMGRECTEKALQWSSKYKDQSHHYKNHKDLNDCLIKFNNPELKQSRGRGMRL